MWYGPAKSGKTRTIIRALQGTDYLFLDFDRNYEDVAQDIEDLGGHYYNGTNAIDVLFQIAEGKAENRVIVIDALNSVVGMLVKHYNKSPEGLEYPILNPNNIGRLQEDTVDFFNKVIYKMENNSNSINFIHHMTENMLGSKMEGNAGAWKSVFDITYEMEDGKFVLKTSRTKIPPSTVGADTAIQRLEAIIAENEAIIHPEGYAEEFLACHKRHIMNIKALRPLLEQLLEEGFLEEVRYGNKLYVKVKDK
jgi:hypothetical protein